MSNLIPENEQLIPKTIRLMRLKHYSIRTERSYINWIKRYVRFHGIGSGVTSWHSILVKTPYFFEQATRCLAWGFGTSFRTRWSSPRSNSSHYTSSPGSILIASTNATGINESWMNTAGDFNGLTRIKKTVDIAAYECQRGSGFIIHNKVDP